MHITQCSVCDMLLLEIMPGHAHHSMQCLRLYSSYIQCSVCHVTVWDYVHVQPCTSLNAVFEIILAYTQSKDWKKSFYEVIPQRKLAGDDFEPTTSSQSSLVAPGSPTPANSLADTSDITTGDDFVLPLCHQSRPLSPTLVDSLGERSTTCIMTGDDLGLSQESIVSPFSPTPAANSLADMSDITATAEAGYDSGPMPSHQSNAFSPTPANSLADKSGITTVTGDDFLLSLP